MVELEEDGGKNSENENSMIIDVNSDIDSAVEDAIDISYSPRSPRSTETITPETSPPINAKSQKKEETDGESMESEDEETTTSYSLTENELKLISELSRNVTGLELLTEFDRREDVIEKIYDVTNTNREAFLGIKKYFFGAKEALGALKTKDRPYTDHMLKNAHIDLETNMKLKKKSIDLDKQTHSNYQPSWQVYGEQFEVSCRNDILNRTLYKGKTAFMRGGTIAYSLENNLSSTPDYISINLDENPLNAVLPEDFCKKIRNALPVLLKPKINEDDDDNSGEDDVENNEQKAKESTGDAVKTEVVKVINQFTRSLNYSEISRARIDGVGECKTSMMNKAQKKAFDELYADYVINKRSLVDHLLLDTKPNYIHQSFVTKASNRRSTAVKGISDDLITALEDCCRHTRWLLYSWEDNVDRSKRRVISLKYSQCCRLKLFNSILGRQCLNELISVYDLLDESLQTCKLHLVLNSVMLLPKSDVKNDGDDSMDGFREDEPEEENLEDLKEPVVGVYTLVNEIEFPKELIKQLKSEVLAAHADLYKDIRNC